MVTVNGKVAELIQCTWSMTERSTRERELIALERAADALKCPILTLITWETEAELEFKGKRIRAIPLFNWLLGGAPS